MSSIKRKAHIMKSEKSMAIPRQLVFFDTETKTEHLSNGDKRQNLKLGWACFYSREHGRHVEKAIWQEFYDYDTFWHFIFKRCASKTRLWCIARNVVFDFTVLKGWQYLKAAGYKCKFFYNQGTTTIVSVAKKGSSIVFLDSMNWFVESLAKTGERIGLPKLSIDFDTCSDSELSTYCRRDVEIEYENFKLFIRFLVANKVARLCYTKGSTAMAAFLLRHYTTKIYIHNNKEAIRLERKSYKGGRCECFYIGDLNSENYYILDVNSLYPCVMRNNLYPVRYEKLYRSMSVSDLSVISRNSAVVAEVLIDTDEPVYAVRDKRTLFPVGRFITTLCTPELKHAIEHNHLKYVFAAVRYKQENIFQSYVDTFYALRQEFKSAGVAEYVELCKKFLNTLYGKFGQKAEEWSKIGTCPNEPDREETVFHTNGRRRTRLRYLLGEVFELTGIDESFDSFPAIAAHVTAYGRLFLWNLMQVAGSENYYYCDTDSLIVNESGLARLADHLHETELGGLKIQESCGHLTIRGLKDYTTSVKHVIKGIRKNAIQLSDGVYKQESWPTFKGMLNRSETETYTVRYCIKHLCREYTKGTVTADGTVVPFVLDAPVVSSQQHHLPF